MRHTKKIQEEWNKEQMHTKAGVGTHVLVGGTSTNECDVLYGEIQYMLYTWIKCSNTINRLTKQK